MFHIHKLYAVELLSLKEKKNKLFLLCQCFCSFYCTLFLFFLAKVNNRKLHNVLGSTVQAKYPQLMGAKRLKEIAILLNESEGREVKVTQKHSVRYWGSFSCCFPCRPLKSWKEKDCDNFLKCYFAMTDRDVMFLRKVNNLCHFLCFHFWYNGIWQAFSKVDFVQTSKDSRIINYSD